MTNPNTKILSRELVCHCGEKSGSFFKKVDTFNLVTCVACGQVRLENVYSDPVSFLEDVKTDEGLEYWGYPHFYKKYETIFTHFFEERYQRLMNQNPVKGEWLDIGSGYGFWQKFLESKNQNNYGLEIEKKAVDYALTTGVAIELKNIEEFSTEKKFAVITMCDVLEHLEKPEETLRKCYEMLLPGGLLYIQVPNVLGLKYPFGDSLGLPHHLWQFEPDTLIRLLKSEKYKICRYWTGIQGVIGCYERGGPTLYQKMMWQIVRFCKRGNRLQLLVSKRN